MFKRLLFALILFFGVNLGYLGFNINVLTAQNSFIAQAQKDGWVMFNTKSYKYHNPWCKWAKKCTRNCIKIKLSDAQKRGGVPCKVCGGTPSD